MKQPSLHRIRQLTCGFGGGSNNITLHVKKGKVRYRGGDRSTSAARSMITGQEKKCCESFVIKIQTCNFGSTALTNVGCPVKYFRVSLTARIQQLKQKTTCQSHALDTIERDPQPTVVRITYTSSTNEFVHTLAHNTMTGKRKVLCKAQN